MCWSHFLIITNVSLVTGIFSGSWNGSCVNVVFFSLDRGLSRLSDRTPQPELHSRDWQRLVRTGTGTFLYNTPSLPRFWWSVLRSPLVTRGRVFSVNVLKGYFEWTLHRFGGNQDSGEGVKSQCKLQGAEWFLTAGWPIQVNFPQARWGFILLPKKLHGFLFFYFFRILQHPNILQCLGQCVEAIPILLVFEYCEMVSVQSPFVLTK